MEHLKQTQELQWEKREDGSECSSKQDWSERKTETATRGKRRRAGENRGRTEVHMRECTDMKRVDTQLAHAEEGNGAGERTTKTIKSQRDQHGVMQVMQSPEEREGVESGAEGGLNRKAQVGAARRRKSFKGRAEGRKRGGCQCARRKAQRN